jgi:hypothetical protein
VSKAIKLKKNFFGFFIPEGPTRSGEKGAGVKNSKKF